MDDTASLHPTWRDGSAEAEALDRELASTGFTCGQVGSQLVSRDARVKVWLIELEPGARLGFHTHVLDYFWTVTRGGRARSRYSDGRVQEMAYDVGQTQHYHFGKGESMTHDLENIGDTLLSFTTVEFLDGANAPLS